MSEHQEEDHHEDELEHFNYEQDKLVSGHGGLYSVNLNLMGSTRLVLPKINKKNKKKYKHCDF